MTCRREIAALTSENYSLERQIFAYQKSISMANNTGNMARLSISGTPNMVSPSKPTSTIGFASSPGSYRTLNHLGNENNYYNSESPLVSASSEAYYERDNGVTEMQQSPSQQAQQQQPAQSYHQTAYFASNFPNSGSSSNSARQSFSGPASPHHHQYHHATQQYQPQPTQQQYHHQLPAIPNQLSYSSSGYRLNSPGATSPMQMYHHMHPGAPDEESGKANGSNSALEDDYNPFAGRYKLKV